MYRSALGKQVDMGSLLLKNEDVRAVGNMNVNARGDTINTVNNINTSRNTQVNNTYNKQIQNQIIDVPPNLTNAKVDKTDEVIEGLDNEIVEENSITDETVNTNSSKENKTKKKKGGLASAIAKAREVEQKKSQTPREESRGKKGVKKI
jgi:hypothetical protein